MDIFIVIFTCVVNLSLGAIILWHDKQSGFARAFAAMSLAICIWIISNYLTGAGMSQLFYNDIANKTAYVSGYSIVLCGLIFTYLFPIKRTVSRLEVGIVNVFSLLVLILSCTSLVAGTVIEKGGQLTFTAGPLLVLYIIGYVGTLGLIARNSLRGTARWDKKSSTQARLVLAAFCISALIGIILNAVIPLLSDDWSSTSFGPLATVLLVVVIVYAIAKHGLFDIRLAVVRTAAYVLSLGTLTVIYYFVAYTLSGIFDSGNSSPIIHSPLSIGLTLVLAFCFQPVKHFFDKVTNRLFYKGSYIADDFYARLNRILNSTTDLRGLLEKVAVEVGQTLKSEQAFFFIKTTGDHYISAGTPQHRHLPPQDTWLINSAPVTSRGVVVGQLLNDSGEIKRMMTSHKIELILTLYRADDVLGYLCLGYNLSSDYTQRDIKLLSTISDELVVAIRNALSVHEVKTLNETLQQRIDEATKELRASNAQLHRLDEAKDEFVSMASHQLRTPLTSVKGYISMVLEGDAGRITANQRHLLGEAFSSSERMVHLINDFLNVSRLQTGKFLIDKRPVDLAKIVGEELDGLASNAEAHDMKFTYKAPKNFPILELDEGKMRQVIMNFADNAIYYSGESTVIEVKLEQVNRAIEFTVKDTGIGVPVSEQAQLFSKFYRASNARRQRPDGTGVGLFLAKKVINAHGGDVIFKSEEGRGSTFGFRLPLPPTKSR